MTILATLNFEFLEVLTFSNMKMAQKSRFGVYEIVNTCNF